MAASSRNPANDPNGTKIAYVNAHILDPNSGMDEIGAILTDGENIAEIGSGLFRDGKGWSTPDGVHMVDCDGACLAPGFVDIRVQTGVPGHEHKGTLASAGRAATSGGITSMVCLPNTEPVIDDMSVVEFVARRARKLGLTKVYPYGAITKGTGGEELAELGMLADAGAVAFTDGVKAVDSAQVMRQALSYASTFDLLLVQHPEERTLAGEGSMNLGELSTRLGLTGIPPQAEVILIERDIRLAELTGGRIHFAHISTADSVNAIRRAKDQGLQVTCDTAPPYFALNETAVGDYRTFAKLSPPLRCEADRQAIVAGLKDGTIDAVASDHSPQDEEAKRLPFSQAAFGGVGLDTLLPITLELYHNAHLDLLGAISLITNRPADLLSLPAGRLAVGAAADLTVFEPDRGWKVDETTLMAKSKNTPFDGRPVQGRVIRTVVDGRAVYELPESK